MIGTEDTHTIKAKFVIDRMSEISSYVSLQGNIGAGKSTLLKSIKKYLINNGRLAVSLNDNILEEEEAEAEQITSNGNCFCSKNDHMDYFIVIDEPLVSWTESTYSIGKFKDELEGIDKSSSSSYSSILMLYYSDMEKYGFLFQIKAFTSRLEHITDEISKINNYHKNCIKKPRIHIIAERSLRTDRVFFKNLYETNVITQVEWAIYNEFYSFITQSVVKKENMMLYLKTPPQKCYDRMCKRDRAEETNGENSVLPDYLISLNNQHDEMVKEFSLIKGNHVIDINFSEDMNQEQIDLSTTQLMDDIIIRVSSI